MAHPFGTRMVGQLNDVFDSRAYVFGLLYEGLSQAARVWLAERHGAAGDRVGVWIFWLPVAYGRTQLLCNQSRLADSRGDSAYRAGYCEHAARRTGRERGHGAALLCATCGGASCAVPAFACFPSVAGSETWQCCAAKRRSEARKPTQHDALHAELPTQGSGDVADLVECSGATGLGVSVAAWE